MFQYSILYSPQNPHMAWIVLPRTAGPCWVRIFSLSWMLTLSHVAFTIKHQIHVISLLPNILCWALAIPLGTVIFIHGYSDAFNGCVSDISLLLSHCLENNTSCLSQFHQQINKSSSQDFVTRWQIGILVYAFSVEAEMMYKQLFTSPHWPEQLQFCPAIFHQNLA